MDWGDEVEALPAIPVETVEVKQFTCHAFPQFQFYLRKMLEPNAMALIPEHIAADFYLEPGASFGVTLVEQDTRRGNSDKSEVSAAAVSADAREDSAQGSQADKASKISMDKIVSTLDAVVEQSFVASHLQTAVATSILASISKIDGFSWFVKNKTKTKQDGWVFDFFCRDSKVNEDGKQNRHHIHTSQAFTKEILNIAVTPFSDWQGLPTFDYKGFVRIRFSSSLRQIVIRYAHSPIHRTIDTRTRAIKCSPGGWIAMGDLDAQLVKEPPESMDVDGQSSDPQRARGAHDNKPLTSQYISPYAPPPAPQSSNQRVDLELDAAISLLQPIYEFVGTSSLAAARHVPPASGYPHSNVAQRPLTTINPAVPTATHPDSSFNNGGSSRVPEAFMYPDPNENNLHSNSVPPKAEYVSQTANSFAGPYHPQHGNPQPLRPSTPSASSVIKAPDIAGSASPQACHDSAQSPASNATTKRTRAKTGCLTCRKRKTKCDEKKPTCERCLKRGVGCTWPDPLTTPKKRGPKPKTLE